jgi:hypothetical protein
LPGKRVTTRNACRGRGLLLVLALIAAAGWLAVDRRWLVVPDEWNPWAPLKIEQPINWLTRFKLERVSADDRRCLAVLGTAAVRFETVPNREVSPGCSFHNAVRVRATSAAVGEPFTLSCRSALSLAIWERHVVQPLARAYFDASVTRIEHFGSYACRNIYNQKDAPLSRHATADALDIAGFILANGKHVRVERDWGRQGLESLFLRDIRDGACRVFDSVLGPEYNAAHRNHFHLDRGGYRVCR